MAYHAVSCSTVRDKNGTSALGSKDVRISRLSSNFRPTAGTRPTGSDDTPAYHPRILYSAPLLPATRSFCVSLRIRNETRTHKRMAKDPYVVRQSVLRLLRAKKASRLSRRDTASGRCHQLLPPRYHIPRFIPTHTSSAL